MDELKKLQGQYKKGKLTKDQYLEGLKKLLEDQEIDQKQHDDAKDFDPNDTDEDPIYSQADVDRMIKKEAARMVRRELKAQGVEVDAPNKDLLGEVAKLAAAGQGKGESTDKELAELRKKAALAEAQAPKLQRLVLENQVLKSAGKYNPVNPSQVVRALDDYRDLLDYDDETGEPTAQSVSRALKRIAQAEPNLFKTPDGNGGNPEDDDNKDDSSFKGKPPGGGTGSGGKGDDLDKKAAEMLSMMGYPKQSQQ